MDTRSLINTNLTEFTQAYYKGYRVITHRGPLAEEYLAGNLEAIQLALSKHRRIFAFRVDLRMPDDFNFNDTAVISRFLGSFNAKVKADLAKKAKQRRVHQCYVTYIWAREISPSESKPHYHLVLMLNAHEYQSLGDVSTLSGNVSAMVKQAWASALRRGLLDTHTLVHFPESPWYEINQYQPDWDVDFADLFYRASYLTKLTTKVYGDNKNSYNTGCLKAFAGG